MFSFRFVSFTSDQFVSPNGEKPWEERRIFDRQQRPQTGFRSAEGLFISTRIMQQFKDNARIFRIINFISPIVLNLGIGQFFQDFRFHHESAVIQHHTCCRVILVFRCHVRYTWFPLKGMPALFLFDFLILLNTVKF